jgi:TonB family protein
VSSAANTVPPRTGGEKDQASGTPRPNPVALETLVNVTGAKASTENGARDLFSEESKTVLVFKDGAVIRLHAEVSVGQLIFLTNKKSNQEVVCQVLRKRSFKQGSCYVELQFTEEREDYWGVAFPEEKKSSPEFKVAAQMEAEQVTKEEPEEPVAPHTAEDVDQLKREVETLREQLAALAKKNVEEAAAKVTAEAAVREAAMRDAEQAVESVTAGAQGHSDVAVNASAHAPTSSGNTNTQEEAKPDLLMPPAPKEDEATARAVVSMSLPVWKLEKSPEEQLLDEEAAAEAKAERKKQEVAEQYTPVMQEAAHEELLPKPALDFSKAPKSGKAASSKGSVVAEKLSPGKARTIALAAVLVLALAGGAWYGKWWQYLPTKKAAANGPHNVVKANVPRAAPAVGGNGKPGGAAPAGVATAGTTATAGVPANSSAGESGKRAVAAKDDKKGESTESDAAAAKAGESEQPAAEKKSSWRERLLGKKSAPKPEEPASAPVVVAVSSDAPLVAAKLLKAANPVYPPDAMRSYITGDVKAEVVVLASGRVGEVKVISGPKALRAAAVDALKQYEYVPATQGGKAVESKAEAVVKFWFNP